VRKLRLSAALLPLLVSLGIVGTAASALASGFAIIEQSVRGLGNAFSGSAAAEDASTIFFNPAGLTRLSGSSVNAAVYYISPSAIFQNQGSTIVTGAPLAGGNGGDGAANILVPNLYAAWDVSDRIKLGLGINSPFGLKTKYNDSWVGRYYAIDSELSTININPTLAAKLTDNLSVGAGINLQYADAKLTNAIDFGLIGFSNRLPTRPQTSDGFVELNGDDWSWGYNLGLLYEASQNTRIGLAFRSPITHNLEGDADFNVPPAAARLTATGRFTDSDIKAKLKLPATVSLNAYQQISPRLAATADITWTGWSRFEELRVEFDNPLEPDNVQPENWHDAFRYALGVNYTLSNAWQLRAGVAYDESPADKEYITARIRDSNRTWVAIGASYKASDSLSFDIGYAHLFVDDTEINQVSTTNGNLRGKFDNHVDIIGLQLNWMF
jgi:long-chain fatty acid transport protein